MPQPPIILVTVEQYQPPQPGVRSYDVTADQHYSAPLRRTYSRLFPPTVVTPLPTDRQLELGVYCLTAGMQRRQYVRRMPLQGHTPAQTTRSNIFADDFNRADGGLGANWVAAAAGQPTGLTILSNQVRTTSGGSASSSTVALTQGDWSTQVDIPVWVNGGQIYLGAIDIQTGSLFSGYLLIISGAAGTVLYRADKGVATAILSVPVQPVNGDTWRVTKQGTTLTVARRLAGANWIDLGSVSESKYLTTGFFTVLAIVTNNNIRVDNFVTVELGLIAAGFNRLIGPRLPTVVNSLVPLKTAASVAMTAIAQRVARTARISHVDLFPPAVLGLPPPPADNLYPIHVTLAPKPRSFVKSYLYPPGVVDAAAAAPTELTVHVTQVRTRPRTVRSFFVFTPVVAPVATVVRVTLAQPRRGRPRTILSPPGLSVPVALEPLIVFARTRPRDVTSRLYPPTVLQTFSGPSVRIVRSRPRDTVSKLAAPTVIGFFQPPVSVTLAARRARRTYQSTLARPVVSAAAAPVDTTISVTFARARPRPSVAKLGRPTVLQTFAGPRVALARQRPKATDYRLAAPTVVLTPTIEQQQRTVRVTLVHARPSHVASVLAKPVVLQTFAGPKVTLARTRPQHTTRLLSPPTVVRVAQVEQALRTIKVATVRARPRRVSSLLTKPTTLQTFLGPLVELTRTRPRKTRTFLPQPAIAAATAVEQTIHVTTVRVRPRRATSKLSPPTTLTVFSGPVVATAHTRPKKTRTFLAPPAVVRVPAVELAEQTVRVTLTKIRPRHTASLLSEPVALQTFSGPDVTAVKSRPRPTHTFLSPPTVVRVPAVELQQQTIRVSLARIRPRPTIERLQPPTTVRVPAVEQREQTISVTLVRARPRPTVRELQPPAVVVVNPPVVTEIAITLSGGSRAERRQRPVRSDLQPPTIVLPLPSLDAQTVSVALTRTRPRRTAGLLAEPTVVSFFQPPVEVTLVRARPRPTRTFLRPQGIVRPEVDRLDIALAARSFDQRRRPRSVLRPPAVVAAAGRGPDAIRVSLAVQARSGRRGFRSELGLPLVAATQVARPVEVQLAQLAKRKTRSRLSPPAVVAPAALARPVVVALAEQSRGRGRVLLIEPVTGPPVETTLQTALTKTRPRPTRRFLSPPAARVPGPPVDVANTAVASRLARRPFRSLLGKATPRIFAAPAIKVVLARIRPRKTVTLLGKPTKILPLSQLGQQTILVRYRAAVENRRKRPKSRYALKPPTKVTTFDGQVEWSVGKPHGSWQARSIDGRWRAGRPRGNWVLRALSGRWRAGRVHGDWEHR